ncbi:hypothetical protein SAMN02745121_05434 [Nannocystis exedens]|uniref:Uncharacterized protein n=1 Tax=Nannocystis exedens TaxID=54 RepID=A0A1I2D7K4_9BACT|nr:hypothetical protein [Nannocystis exedens]PCC70681.1 hypothetical protein NAEX_03745 [Nannocystis exedens]SFE76484.1 hypothetical protein SAMN02745121_05434 [Nannocystis exedens]
MADPEISARSPDGVWRFESGRLSDGSRVVELETIDFFDRWTFARFCPGGQLILGFESGQPWSESGSYGDRYGGLQVFAPTADPARWQTVAIEYDYRSHDATFIPDDVVWHPRGVLAWLHDGCLCGQVLKEPRGPVDLLWNPRDSDFGLEYYFERWGVWRRLELDEHGHLLTAYDPAGCDRYDLVHRRTARDDGEWEALAVY